MDNDNCIEIRIYQLEDRLDVARILVKNGYTVSQVKRKREGQKTLEYCLLVQDTEDSIKATK